MDSIILSYLIKLDLLCRLCIVSRILVECTISTMLLTLNSRSKFHQLIRNRLIRSLQNIDESSKQKLATFSRKRKYRRKLTLQIAPYHAP